MRTAPAPGSKLLSSTIVHLAAGVLLLGLSFWLPARNQLSWIDPLTASTKWESQWFGLTTSQIVVKSPIEDWMVARGLSIGPRRWQLLSNRGSNAWGHGQSRGCRGAPPIHDLHQPEIGRAFLRTSTDQQINDFLALMRCGTQAEQKASVEQALDRILAEHNTPFWDQR